MRINNTEYAGLSPAEKAKQDRRLARAIQQGIPRTKLTRFYGVTTARLEQVAATFGLTINVLPPRRGKKRA